MPPGVVGVALLLSIEVELELPTLTMRENVTRGPKDPLAPTASIPSGGGASMLNVRAESMMAVRLSGYFVAPEYVGTAQKTVRWTATNHQRAVT